MARVNVILILGLCLAFQLVYSFPLDFSASDEENETTEQRSEDLSTTTTDSSESKYAEEETKIIKNTEQSSESESEEETLYLPAEYDTPIYRLQLSNFRLLYAHSNNVITEGRDFLKVALKAMNALPDITPGIQANITRMSNLLERIERIDLSKNSFGDVEEKSEIIDALSDLYLDFAAMLHYQVPKEDAAVLTLLFSKIDLHGFNVRIKESLAKTVKKITKLVDGFFAKLTEEEKQKYTELIEWYEGFQKLKDDQDKFNEAVVLFQYLLLHPLG